MEEWRYSSTILDLGTRRRSLDTFSPRPFHSWVNCSRHPLDRRLGGPQSRSGRSWEEQIPGVEPGPTSSLFLVERKKFITKMVVILVIIVICIWHYIAIFCDTVSTDEVKQLYMWYGRMVLQECEGKQGTLLLPGAHLQRVEDSRWKEPTNCLPTCRGVKVKLSL
jgi:hypothetical protein